MERLDTRDVGWWSEHGTVREELLSTHSSSIFPFVLKFNLLLQLFHVKIFKTHWFDVGYFDLLFVESKVLSHFCHMLHVRNRDQMCTVVGAASLALRMPWFSNWVVWEGGGTTEGGQHPLLAWDMRHLPTCPSRIHHSFSFLLLCKWLLINTLLKSWI